MVTLATTTIDLSTIVSQLQTTLSSTSLTAWENDQDNRGDLVDLFRRYAEGNHRASLTTEMKNLLRIDDATTLNRLNNNYMDVVIQTMVDRLNVSSIQADNEAATAWINDLLAINRFDAMQDDVHEGTARDADAYVLVYYDNELSQVRFSFEPAWDGTTGMLALYESTTDTLPAAAIKVWYVGDRARVNYYYPNRIERYISTGGNLEAFDDYTRLPLEARQAAPNWLERGTGKPIGVPVIHFRNRSNAYGNYGVSELINAIPLQDATNRVLYSSIMAAELTAFQIKIARGFKPPAGIAPGDWVEISPNEPIEAGVTADANVLPQAQLVPFLDMLRYLTGEIGKITRTPSPEFAGGDNASGEALKQREIGLLGKVRRFQVKAGNSWEDVAVMAHKIQSVFGSQPPAYTRFSTQWSDAEIRNDEVAIKNAVLVADRVGDEEFLNLIAPIFDYSQERIAKILASKRSAQAAQLQTALDNMPRFGGAIELGTEIQPLGEVA